MGSRLVRRFRTRAQFESEMAADYGEVRDTLISSRRVLRQAFIPDTHGHTTVTFDLSSLDLPSKHVPGIPSALRAVPPAPARAEEMT